MIPPHGTVLIRGARQLITLRGPKEPRRGAALAELGIIADGSVLIRDGILEEVGPTRRVENLTLARGAEEIDATGRVVMPGFVDAHTRLCARAGGACERAAEPAWHREAERGDGDGVTRKRLEWKARTWVEAMVRHGTTTLEAETDGGEGMKGLRVLAALDGTPLEVVATFLARVEGAGVFPVLAEEAGVPAVELMARIRNRRLARFVALRWPSEQERQEQARIVVEAAHQLGFPLKVHDHCNGEPSGLRTAVESGAVTVDSLRCMGDEDIQALAGSGTMTTLLPAVGFHERLGRYAPGRKLVDAGAAVALGSGFHPVLAPTLSMQAVISLACTRLGLTPEEAISAATVNAAYALRCAGHAGSLEYGKAADLVMLDVSDYRDLAHHLGHNMVALTIKSGTVIYRQGGVERALLDQLKPTA